HLDRCTWHAGICYTILIAHHPFSYSFLSFLLLFLSRLRLPPRSPLFPYTTLFRSSPAARISARAPGDGPASSDRSSASSPTARQDRKSTRLNSSHGSISYAVFCLKKKKYI